MENMLSLSDVFTTGSQEYYRVLTYLRRHATHPCERKGRKTYWHSNDIKEAQETRKQFKWRERIDNLFATPKTVYDVLDELAEEGIFVELDATRRQVWEYEKEGHLKCIGYEATSAHPRHVYVSAAKER